MLAKCYTSPFFRAKENGIRSKLGLGLGLVQFTSIHRPRSRVLIRRMTVRGLGFQRHGIAQLRRVPVIEFLLREFFE